MAFLVSDVMARVLQDEGGFYPASDPDALVLLNEVHQGLVRDCGLYAHSDLIVDLSAAVGEYPLDPSVYQVVSATYWTAPGSYKPLFETSVDWLDYNVRTWRQIAPATPFRYYAQGPNVGLWPVPRQGTVAGWPYVALRVLQSNRLVSFSDPLPVQVPSMDAWVYGLLAKWAIGHGDAAIQKYVPLAESARRDLMAFTNARLVRQKPEVRARVPRVRNP